MSRVRFFRPILLLAMGSLAIACEGRSNVPIVGQSGPKPEISFDAQLKSRFTIHAASVDFSEVKNEYFVVVDASLQPDGGPWRSWQIAGLSERGALYPAVPCEPVGIAPRRATLFVNPEAEAKLRDRLKSAFPALPWANVDSEIVVTCPLGGVKARKVRHAMIFEEAGR